MKTSLADDFFMKFVKFKKIYRYWIKLTKN